MYYVRNKIKRITRQVFVLILFFIFTGAFSQGIGDQDTILNIQKGSYLHMKDIKSFVSHDTSLIIPASLTLGTSSSSTRTKTFYDSLKIRASKSKLGKAIYDLVIVAPKTSKPNAFVEKSEEPFTEYSGFRIRKVNITRLNVFGTSIDNPGSYEPKKGERLLNGTHVNSNEKIIRNYLLFREGDTLSPLKLTDNERILRQLPYIDDARILVVPVSDDEADIIVVTKDVYSLGGELTLKGPEKGSVWLFEKNILGLGHEFKLEIPYSTDSDDSPGVGLNYYVNNIRKSFINLSLNYYNAIDIETYGISLSRSLISSETKYAGGVSARFMLTTEDLDTLPEPLPLKYTFQDYWLQRSFLINRNNVSRIMIAGRYINNNVFEKPPIRSDTYYSLQKYKLYLGSVAFSMQKYYKTNLIYNYGRTEDVPYGALFRATGGLELNEFKKRYYLGADASFGSSIRRIGYFYVSGGFGTFLNNNEAEQGVLSLKMEFFSNLIPAGRSRIRNFLNIDYTRGIGRYEDEYLKILKENGFAGFRNDSIRGEQRVKLSFETVIFSPANLIGFRFAFFGFTDLGFLAGTHEIMSNGVILTGIGLGIRIRNDNLIFNTLQVRIGFYPSAPDYSRINNITISGEQLLRPENFDPGPPSVYRYR